MKQKKSLSILFAVVFVIGLFAVTGCSSDSDSDYEDEDDTSVEEDYDDEYDEDEPEISADGADFTVKLIKQTKKGVTIKCTNTSDEDHVTCIVNSIDVNRSSYDPADENGRLKLTQDGSETAWIELNAGGSAKIKVSCKDCKSASDYNDLSINFDENVFSEEDPSPETYEFKDLNIKINK